MATTRTANTTTTDPMHGGAVHVPRSRGALSGVLLVLLGAWGALAVLIGPVVDFGLAPDTSWHWTAARFWLEILPGAAVFLGGLLLLLSANRITASAGGWLAVAGGAWFVVGRDVADVLHLGSPGAASGSSKGVRLLETLTLFNGLGAVIVFLAAGAVGRLSVRSVRDVRAAQRREVAAGTGRRHAEVPDERTASEPAPGTDPGTPSGAASTAQPVGTSTGASTEEQSREPQR